MLVGALFLCAVLAELPYVNGPEYWRWPWRYLDFGRTLQAFAGPLLFYGYLVQRWSNASETTAREATRVLGGLVLCGVMFMAAGLYVRPKTLEFTLKFVHHPGATGYFTDALRIDSLEAFLRDYATLSRAPHSETHPPGPVLFWWLCLKAAGDRVGVFLGTAMLAVGASLATVQLYMFGTLWTQNRKERLAACFFWVLLPGLIVNLPELDQVYPILSMLMLWCWSRVVRGSLSASFLLGASLFVITFFAYNLLTLGAPMVLFAALQIRRAESRRVTLGVIARGSVISLLTCAGLYLLLWLATSYDALGTFKQAFEAQHRVSLVLARPYLPSLLFAVYDFALGAGMLVVPLLVLHLASEGSERRQVTVAFLIALVVIDVSGLLPCETSRIWLFLQPLIIVPAGLQLARFSTREQGWVLAMQAVVVMVLRSKMEFFP